MLQFPTDSMDRRGCYGRSGDCFQIVGRGSWTRIRGRAREMGARVRKHATIYLFVFSAKYFFIRNDRFERIVPLRNARVKNAKTLTCFENRYVIFPNTLRSSSTPSGIFYYIYKYAMCTNSRKQRFDRNVHRYCYKCIGYNTHNVYKFTFTKNYRFDRNCKYIGYTRIQIFFTR